MERFDRCQEAIQRLDHDGYHQALEIDSLIKVVFNPRRGVTTKCDGHEERALKSLSMEVSNHPNLVIECS